MIITDLYLPSVPWRDDANVSRVFNGNNGPGSKQQLLPGPLQVDDVHTWWLTDRPQKHKEQVSLHYSSTTTGQMTILKDLVCFTSTYRRFFSCTHTDSSGSPSWCLPGEFLRPGTSAHPPPSFEGHLDPRTSWPLSLRYELWESCIEDKHRSDNSSEFVHKYRTSMYKLWEYVTLTAI